MTISSASPGQMSAHDLMLALAGRIPDLTLAQARRMIADGAASSAIAHVASVLADYPIALTEREITAIRALARDPAALPGAGPAEPGELAFGFSPRDADGQIGRDQIDDALVAAAEAHVAGLSGVWRTWRYVLVTRPGPAAVESAPAEAQEGAEAPPESEGARSDVGNLAVAAREDPFHPHRVYIVQVEDAGLIQGLAADLFAVIPDAADAGIEIVVLDQELPPYQAAALSEALLLWATVTEPEFTVARVFDFADPQTGPGFTPDHPRIEDSPERKQLLAYLRGGYPVLTTTASMGDILDPEAGAVVPTSFRTDGVWIWTDTVEYYLSQHGVVPDARLTAHISAQRDRGRPVPDTDTDTASRAADFLLHPPAASAPTAVWFPGGTDRA